MATDDEKPKPRKASGDAPPKKKKKKRPVASPGASGETPRPARAARVAGDIDDVTPPPPPVADDPDEETALAIRAGETSSLDASGDEVGAPPSRSPLQRDDDDEAPAQLGVERYVLAAFFATGLVGAYIVGRMIHGIWANLANRDFFSQNVPTLAAVQDDTKTTIGLVLGGIISLVVIIYLYRREDIRIWADKVADELNKVKWPTKKDVTNSTLVVIAASTVATLYLALLDRLWAFVTNLVYGTGS